jgi:subtilisin family serine protease
MAIGRSRAKGGSSKGYGRQWFTDRIRRDEAFAAAGTRGRKLVNGQPTGEPVVVAVLDTGIDLSHPAFNGRLVAQADMWDFVDNDNDPGEVGALRVDAAYGHGTHVAGIVALTVPDARIMPIRILGQDGSGELWRITAGLIWAASHGAEIANLSIGYPDDVRVLHDLLDCFDLGMTADGTTFPEIGTHRLAVSVAAGNGGSTTPVFPAAEQRDGMLSVGASTRYDMLAGFSSYDRHWVDVTAPGEEIVGPIPGGRYAMWSGTSMAAPIVAGIAALLKATDPNWSTFPTPHDLLGRIKETSVDKRMGVLQPWNTDVRLDRVDALCAVQNDLQCPIPFP